MKQADHATVSAKKPRREVQGGDGPKAKSEPIPDFKKRSQIKRNRRQIFQCATTIIRKDVHSHSCGDVL